MSLLQFLSTVFLVFRYLLYMTIIYHKKDDAIVDVLLNVCIILPLNILDIYARIQYIWSKMLLYN